MPRRSFGCSGAKCLGSRSALKGRPEAGACGQADLGRYDASLSDGCGGCCGGSVHRRRLRGDRRRCIAFTRIEETGPLEASAQREEGVFRRRTAIGSLGMAAEARQIEASGQGGRARGRAWLGPRRRRGGQRGRHDRRDDRLRRHHFIRRRYISLVRGRMTRATATCSGKDASTQEEKGCPCRTCDRQYVIVVGRDRCRAPRRRCRSRCWRGIKRCCGRSVPRDRRGSRFATACRYGATIGNRVSAAGRRAASRRGRSDITHRRRRGLDHRGGRRQRNDWGADRRRRGGGGRLR